MARTAIDSSLFKTSPSLTGDVTQPNQPCFLVTDGTGESNTTGDGTTATKVWPTEVYDQGADFASNTFTAPVSGRYLLSAAITLGGLASGHTGTAFIRIDTSNRTYVGDRHSNGYVAATSTQFLKLLTGTVIADMDAGDTATVVYSAAGSTKVVDVNADASATYFSGSLIN